MSSNNILFSIIVPIYNVEKYLRKCVETLINQTYKNIEIILVDDESPDACPEICDEFAKMDERIVVIHKKNGGLSDARNAGISAARGKYLLFVDSDDYIDENTCEKFSKYTDMRCQVIMGEAIVEGGEKSLSHINCSEVMSGNQYLMEAYTEKKVPMVAWLNIIERDFLLEKKLFFKKGILHEDEEFTPRLILNSDRIVITSIPFYHYVIRDNSIMTQKNKEKNARDFYQTCLELEKYYGCVSNRKLKNYLLDDLVKKYLNLYMTGRLYQYGKQYNHKKFMIKNAKETRTLFKVFLYVISPRCYCYVNRKVKGK